MQGVGSVLSIDAKFRGELSTDGSISVNGQFEGKLIAKGEVVISPSGHVIGEVFARSVIISGKVDGHIHAKENIELLKTGRVHGDISGGSIVLEDGSFYQGKVKVASAPEEKPEEFPPAEV